VTSEHTLVERDGGLVTVTLNRPEKKNAINSPIWMDLDEILREVESNPSDRALLLAGAGGNFSSGADLSGGLSAKPEPGSPEALAAEERIRAAEAAGERVDKGGLTGKGRQLIIHDMRLVGDIIQRLQRLPKPTIAAVDGVAIGVALGLAVACDLVVASERATFREVFVQRGLALDGGASWTLPRLIGLRRAKQMTFFGDAVDAATALEWGLVNEVVAPDDLMATATEWAQRLANGPTTALSIIKRLLESGLDSSIADALEDEARAQHIVFGTHDFREGMTAYFERRPPNFIGE